MSKRALFAFAALLLVIGVPLQLSAWYGIGSQRGAPVWITVAKGASLAAVSASLNKAGLVEAPRQFLLLARLLGGSEPVQAGTYKLIRGDAWRSYLRIMQTGRVERFSLLIPEGMASVLVAERLRAETRLAGEVAVPAEGSVLPETYDFVPGELRSAVLARMQAAMKKTIAELWPGRSARSVVKTPEQAVILASIVEKETGKAAERRHVAGVYGNRLTQGMKLDADPTVIYPITQGKPLGRRIRRSELAADTGYNTYLKAGLPVGPIANPGRASLVAVLDPAPTGAFFFVADGSGGHVFAATLAEHNSNVAKWYALRRQRGEM